MTLQPAVDAYLIAACDRKGRYVSEQYARMVARDRLRAGDAGADRLWPYACAHCRGWHLTKRPNPGMTAVTARERWEGIAA